MIILYYYCADIIMGGVRERARVYGLYLHIARALVYYLRGQLSIFKMDISYGKSGASCLAFCGNSWPPTKKERNNDNNKSEKKINRKEYKYNAERQEKTAHRHRNGAGRFLIWSLPVLFTLFLLFNFFPIFAHHTRARARVRLCVPPMPLRYFPYGEGGTI